MEWRKVPRPTPDESSEWDDAVMVGKIILAVGLTIGGAVALIWQLVGLLH